MRYPTFPKREIVWRLHFMLGAMSYAIAGTDILQVITGLEISDISQKKGSKSEARLLSERLMPFLLGGLRAALPQIDDSFHSTAAAQGGPKQHSVFLVDQKRQRMGKYQEDYKSLRQTWFACRTKTAIQKKHGGLKQSRRSGGLKHEGRRDLPPGFGNPVETGIRRNSLKKRSRLIWTVRVC